MNRNIIFWTLPLVMLLFIPFKSYTQEISRPTSFEQQLEDFSQLSAEQRSSREKHNEEKIMKMIREIPQHPFTVKDVIIFSNWQDKDYKAKIIINIFSSKTNRNLFLQRLEEALNQQKDVESYKKILIDLFPHQVHLQALNKVSLHLLTVFERTLTHLQTMPVKLSQLSEIAEKFQFANLKKIKWAYPQKIENVLENIFKKSIQILSWRDIAELDLNVWGEKYKANFIDAIVQLKKDEIAKYHYDIPHALNIFSINPIKIDDKYKQKQIGLFLSILPDFIKLNNSYSTIKDLLLAPSTFLHDKKLSAAEIKSLFDTVFANMGPANLATFLQSFYEVPIDQRKSLPADQIQELAEKFIDTFPENEIRNEKWDLTQLQFMVKYFPNSKHLNLLREIHSSQELLYWEKHNENGKKIFIQHALKKITNDECSQKLPDHFQPFSLSEEQKLANLSCSICFCELEENGTPNFKNICGTSHLCSECLKQHFQTEMDNNRETIQCPSKDACSGRATLNDFYKSGLSQNNLDLYLYKRGVADLSLTGERCTNGQCFMFVTPDKNEQGKPLPFSSCPLCHEDYCFSCHGSHSQKMKCEDYQSQRKYAQSPFNALDLKIHPCPHCSAVIEKSEACDHMICTSCNKQFDWITGKKYRKNVTYGGFSSGTRPENFPDLPRTYRVRGEAKPSTGEIYQDYKDDVIDDLPPTEQTLYQQHLEEIIKYKGGVQDLR